MGKLIFISHSSKDEKIATELCEYLEKNGKSCFIAPRNIRYGREYAEEIIEGIDNSAVMVLVLSANSNQSDHVLREVERAVSKSVPILTYKIEDVELSKSMEYFLMTNQWMDAERKSGFSDVLACINGLEAEKEGKDKSIIHSSEVQDIKERTAAGTKKMAYIYGAAALLAVLCIAVVALALWKGKDSSGNKTGENTESQTTALIDNEESQNNTTAAANKEPDVKDLQVGDNVNFGTYNGEEIEWRVLHLSEDKKEAVLISKDILCMKAFDAAEGGAYNSDGTNTDYWIPGTEADTNMELQIQVRGNSDWSSSNIRTWLNSKDEVVKYADQKPRTQAMSEKKNGYDLEAGFLHGFSEEERAAIVEVENSTKGNALSEKKEIKTKDKVYLLSLEELEWFEEAGMSMLAKPSNAAVEQDKTKWYNVYIQSSGDNENYCWWLREPVEDCASKCYQVGNGYLEDNIWNTNVGLEGYGVRPAITVNLEKLPN